MKKSGIILVIFSLFFGLTNNLSAQNNLTGTVNYDGNDTQPIPDVTVGLYDMQDVLVMSTITDENGSYSFESIPVGEYNLRSSTNIEPNTIDIQDAHSVLFSAINQIELDDVQFEAADIDNSGTVTMYDFLFIRVKHLLKGKAFPAGDWQFEEVYIDYTSRDAPPDTTDLWGISEGDVEGYWEPSGRDLDLMDYTYYPVQLESNELQLEIKSDINDHIAGFNINLAYPANQLNIVDVIGPDNNLDYVVDETNGSIKIIWMDENNSGRISADNLVSVVVEAKTTELEGTAAFELLPGSMIIDTKGKKIENVEIQLPLLEKKQNLELQVSTYPNPVVDELHISLNLNEANYASISIFDASGRKVVNNNNISLESGEQLITVNVENFKPGYYFYAVELLGNTPYATTGKIIKSQ